MEIDMNPPRCVMLLIDADNVSIGVMTQAVDRLLAEYGALHVRRAYCTAESAVKHQQAFKRLSIKPMVNLAAGKNSTDIAMAVDALDLVLAERPDVVVIASSDSDFAPLVSRLREKGCRVRGIGQKGKTGEETLAVYDDFVEFDHRGADEGGTPAPRRRAAARSTAGAKAEVKAGAKAGTAAAKSAQRSRSPAAAAVPAAATLPDASEAAGAGEPAAAPMPAPAARKTAARKTAAVKTVAARSTPAKATARKRPAAATEAVADEAVAPAPAARKRAARKSAPAAVTTVAAPAAARPLPEAPEAAAAPPAEVRRLIDALGGLPAGAAMSLQSAAERLRKTGLLSKSSSARKLLARHPAWFALEPADDPRRLVRRA
jgi:uncharacterized protein (TIGR00288 family)